MVGIYKDEFVRYLEENLGYVKVTAKNIICPCPWCEYEKRRKHYHLYISLEAPIFHCFQAKCEKSGFIQKLLHKISGIDDVSRFVDKSLIQQVQVKKTDSLYLKEKKLLVVPELKTDNFKMKTMYIKYRLGYDIDVTSLKNLVFDVKEFVNVNKIELDERSCRILDFLQSNFVGFLTEMHSLLVLRNIDPSSSFRYYKLDLRHDTEFLDYYKVQGSCPGSNKVVVSEGIFDILVENVRDSLKIRDSVFSYFASLSGSFHSLVKSIAFYEQIFRQDVVVLSHSDVGIDAYKKLKKSCFHVIDKLEVYYNEYGKDFAETRVKPIRVCV